MANTVAGTSRIWRSAGGDNSRRGLSEWATRLARTPARRLLTDGAVQAAVVFNQAGSAFIADMASGVRAYAPDGQARWQVKVDGGISATPVMHPDDASLFVATHTGQVYGLDASSGAARWRRGIPSKSDPRILSDLLHLPRADLVVFSSWGGRFHALEARTGQERFSWEAGISPWAAAASDRDDNIYCLRARPEQGLEFARVDGQGRELVLFREPEDARGARRALVAAAPVLDEGRAVAYFVVNQARGGLLVAWSLATGKELWRQRLPAAVQATLTVLQTGGVMVADLAGGVHGYGPDGAHRFRYATGSEYLLAGGVGQADDTFWIGDPLGILHSVDRGGAGVSWFEAPRSIQARLSFDPSGRLYVPCADRSVYVLAG
jgi:outer membrane protein assembly factor BamB